MYDNLIMLRYFMSVTSWKNTGKDSMTHISIDAMTYIGIDSLMHMGKDSVTHWA